MIGHPKVGFFITKHVLALTHELCSTLLKPSPKVSDGDGQQTPFLQILILALTLGVDIICAQGGEGGGHTGDTAFSILIPAVVNLCKNAKSPLTGEPVIVVAAGGIADGRGLAAALV
jgi:hypothetical protein